MAKKEKEKAKVEINDSLQTAVDQIEKQFGKGSIMRLGEATNMNVEVIPTGSLSLDLALGVGFGALRIWVTTP